MNFSLSLACIVILTLLIGDPFHMQELHVFPLLDAPLTGDEIPEQKLGDSRFTIMRKRVTQAEAHLICERTKRENRLAVFPTLKIAYDVSMMILNISDPYTPEYDEKNGTTEWGLDRRYWIGLIDYLEEGDWQWLKTNGENLNYDFWYGNQPDHNTDRNNRPEHCATFWNPGYQSNEYHTFNDEMCLNRHYFICEDVPPVEATPMGRRFGAFGNVLVDEDNSTLPFGVTLNSDEMPARPMSRGHIGDTSESLESEESEEKSTEVIENLSNEALSHEEGDARRAEGEEESESSEVGQNQSSKNISHEQHDSINQTLPSENTSLKQNESIKEESKSNPSVTKNWSSEEISHEEHDARRGDGEKESSEEKFGDEVTTFKPFYAAGRKFEWEPDLSHNVSQNQSREEFPHEQHDASQSYQNMLSKNISLEQNESMRADEKSKNPSISKNWPSEEISHEEHDDRRGEGEKESSEEKFGDEVTTIKSFYLSHNVSKNWPSEEISHEEHDARRGGGEKESSEEKFGDEVTTIKSLYLSHNVSQKRSSEEISHEEHDARRGGGEKESSEEKYGDH